MLPDKSEKEPEEICAKVIWISGFLGSDLLSTKN